MASNALLDPRELRVPRGSLHIHTYYYYSADEDI